MLPFSFYFRQLRTMISAVQRRGHFGSGRRCHFQKRQVTYNIANQLGIVLDDKVLGKTHPDTLMTIMNMAIVYKKTENFAKAEDMYTQALDGHEKSLGKDHADTKNCARNLAILLDTFGTRKKDLRKVLDAYPHLEQAESWYYRELKGSI